jgi:hypothetical protein
MLVVKLPIETPVVFVWVASTKAHEGVGCLGEKETWEEVGGGRVLVLGSTLPNGAIEIGYRCNGV